MYLTFEYKQYLLMLHTDSKIVIIKNEGRRATIIKFYHN